jgi:selenocysteine lyase/cysteine desulfurase
VEAYESAVGPRTRLAIVEHITAQSAVVFPLRETAARLRAQWKISRFEVSKTLVQLVNDVR